MPTSLFAGREALRNVDVAIGAVDSRVEHDRRTHVIETGDIDVFLGLDVGKGEHHAAAVPPAGKKAFDKRLPNTEPKLRELFAKLQAKHGTVLVVVDQPASIGALPLAVARDMGCPVAYLPGLTMHRIADLYPGEAKTDGWLGEAEGLRVSLEAARKKLTDLDRTRNQNTARIADLGIPQIRKP